MKASTSNAGLTAGRQGKAFRGRGGLPFFPAEEPSVRGFAGGGALKRECPFPLPAPPKRLSGRPGVPRPSGQNAMDGGEPCGRIAKPCVTARKRISSSPKRRAIFALPTFFLKVPGAIFGVCWGPPPRHDRRPEAEWENGRIARQTEGNGVSRWSGRPNSPKCRAKTGHEGRIARKTGGKQYAGLRGQELGRKAR